MVATLKGKRIIPYARASRLDERTPEVALREYREQCERWAESQDVILLPFRGDVDQSGGKLYGRPALEEVMDAIAKGEADGVVTPYVSRFSRAGLRDALDRIEEVRLLGAAFIPLDVSDALSGSDLALNIALTVANEELRKQTLNWRRGDIAAAKLGVHLGKAPAGYRHADGPSPIRGGNGGRLEIDPQRAPVIRQAWEIHASRGGTAALAYLREHDRRPDDVPYPWTPGRWRRTTTGRGSRVYLGETRLDLYETRRVPLRGDGGKLLREASGRLRFEETRVLIDSIVVPGAHPALIDEATWLRAQDGHEEIVPRSRSKRYPLSHPAVTCERCGTRIIGTLSDGRYRTYRCGSGGAKAGAVMCGPFAQLHAGPLEERVRTLLVERAVARQEELEEFRTLADLREQLADGEPLSEEDIPASVEPERRALEEARHDLEETRAAQLPTSVKAAAIEAAERAVAAAQDRYAVALREADPEPQAPEPEQIAFADASELPEILRDFGLRVVVSPERGDVADRVRLEDAQSALA